MRNFCIFADAVNYIEENLCSRISQEDIAAACCCSLSALQKVWRFCSHTSIKEYISKRQMTRCAEEMLRGDSTLIEIALKYGYNSPEVFTRAFRKLWGVSPSQFRRDRHSTGLYPRMIPDESRLEGGVFMGRKLDISELYDMLRANNETYVLCCDIENLMTVNETLGEAAGDCVIREAFRRIDSAAGDGMTAFRIGGDEFALVTRLSDREEVRKLGEQLIAQNGDEIEFEDRKIAVSMHVGAIKLASAQLHYSELSERLDAAIIAAHGTDTRVFFAE